MKRIIMLITAIAVMFGGLAFVAPVAANAESVEIVITGEDSAVVDESVKLKETARARADGKTQLSYFNPNAKGWSLAKAKKCKLIYVSIKWSKTKIKRVVKANKRKVNGTWCVRLKHGSTWANSGKEGKRDVPFTATVRGKWSLMTLKYPARGIWVHKGEFSGGRFFMLCDNWWMIGVKPVLTDQQVVMVRSEAEVEYRNDWELGAEVKGTLYATYVCGGATIEIEASVRAWAYDEGSFYLKASSLAQAQARGGERVSVMSLASVTANARHKAMVGAEYELRLKATCNQEPVFEAPTVDVTPVACVNPGTTRDVTITVSNPNDEADTVKVTYRGQVLPTKPVAAHGQVTFTLANQAAGTYSGTALLVNANKSKSFTVTVEECPPTPPTIDEIVTINDVVEYNARTVNVMGTGTPGEVISLFATAKNGGSITARKNQTVTVDGNGNWSATVEYTAGETPKQSLTYTVDGVEYTIAAGKDVVWFHATNPSGQDAWAKSNDFDITPRPVTP